MSHPKKKVLVTGCMGYIGSVLRAELSDYGYRVSGFDKVYMSRSGQESFIKPPHPIQFYMGDVRDYEELNGVVDAVKPDFIVHAAGLISVAGGEENPHEYMTTNGYGTANVVRAAEEHGVKAMVYLSSAAVYGNGGEKSIQEDAPKDPMSTYGRSKLMGEWAVKASKIPSAILRLFNVAGATQTVHECHENETHLIPLLLQAARTGNPLRIFGREFDTIDGTCVRDYVHVRDVAYTVARVLHLHFTQSEERPFTFKSFVMNVGTGIGYSVLQVLQYAQSVTNKEIPVIFTHSRFGDPAVLVPDVTQLGKGNYLVDGTRSIGLHEIVKSQWDRMCEQQQSRRSLEDLLNGEGLLKGGGAGDP